MSAGGELDAGWVADELRAEFPELRLWSVRHVARPQRSPPGLRERLRVLSSRFYGAQAVQLRTDPIPHAYRVFYRHIGLEPDEVRVPIEALVLERLLRGEYPSRGRLPDALAIACIETGRPVWALDADRLTGAPGVRLDEAARLVLADERQPLALLFDTPGPPFAADRDSTRLALVTVVVPGVPALFAEEALWIAGEALAA
jgi:hypothetical protein